MTCITCHDPHLTSEPAHSMTVQETCTQCHQPAACTAHSTLPEAVTDDCVGCHMRDYAKINVNFDLADDSYVPPLTRSNHHISIDPIGTKEVLLEWNRSQDGADANHRTKQLESDLLAYWLEQGEERQQQGRFTAAISSMREALKISPDSKKIHDLLEQYIAGQRKLDDLRSRAEHAMRNGQDRQALRLFDELVQTRPDEASVVGRIGTLHARLGDQQQAREYLKKSVELDPDEQYGLSMLAWMQYLEKDFERAAALYEQADAVEPFNSKINYLWGESLANTGKIEEAMRRFETSIESDPRNLDALRAYAALCMHTNKPASGLSAAEDAVRLTDHDSPMDLMILAEIHYALGAQDVVSKIIGHTLELTSKKSPAIHAEIQSWARQRGIAY